MVEKVTTSNQELTGNDKSDGEKPAWRCRNTIILFILITAAGLAGDLLSKHYAFKSVLDDDALPKKIEDLQNKYEGDLSGMQLLGLMEKKRLAPGVQITLSLNPGIVFSLSMPKAIVHIATAITLLLVIMLFVTSSDKAWSIHIALALIMAGALGNWYDRAFSSVTLPGADPIRHHVRDFIDCSELYYNYIFNVADVLLVVGVAKMILHRIITGRKQASVKTSDTPRKKRRPSRASR